MPVFKVIVTSTFIEIFKASNDFVHLDFAGVILPDSQAKADEIARFIQEEYLDVRQKLNTLPNDDPDRTTDPALLTQFWDGPGSPGQTDLVGRSVLITVEWTGIEYIPTLKRL